MKEVTFTACQQRALDINHSVGVSASAGTGKTFLLQNRVAKLLKSGKAFPRDILCLTYSEKAAAEMREKIEKELRNQSDNEIMSRTAKGMTEEEARENPVTKALESIHQCTISTFHGFCSALLHEFPMEAGVPIRYAIMDALATQELVTDTIDETLNQPDETLYEDVTLLLSHLSRKDVLSAIEKFYNVWTEHASWFDDLENNPEIVSEQWEEWKKEIVEEVRDWIVSDGELEKYHAIENSNKKSRENLERLISVYQTVKDASTYEEKYRSLLVFSQQTKIPTGKIYDGLDKYYISVVKKSHVISSCLPFEKTDPRRQLMIAIMQAAGRITRHVYSVIVQRKKDGGFLDFNDLIWYVERMFDTNQNIVDELKKRYKFLLVDEVQDNDAVLTKLVRRLAGNPQSGNKLFVVGDMKQAIYQFRGAKPDEFKKLIHEFSEKPVELDVNYRTVPYLINVINQVFTQLFRSYPEDDIQYPQIQANRQTSVGTFTRIHTSEEKGEEAKILASWIYSKVSAGSLMVCDSGEITRPATYRDFTVLIRKKSSLTHLIAAFKEYGIPYHVHKGSGLFKEPEIVDLLNVIKASVYRNDDIALYGALISPYFGISDELLATVLAETGNESQSLWNRLSKMKNAEIAEALGKLSMFREVACYEQMPTFLRTIVRKTGILSVYGADPNAMEKIRNLRKFLDLASSLQVADGVSLYSFLRTVDICLEKDIDDNDIGGVDAGLDSEDRVGIMTCHVSKGLEFPVVILYNSGTSGIAHHDTTLIHPYYHCGFKQLKDPVHSDLNLFGFLSDLIEKANRPDAEAGERRLFYVGMTRPRDHLVLSSTGNKAAENSFFSFYEGNHNGVEADLVSATVCNPPVVQTDCDKIRDHHARMVERLQACTPSIDEYTIDKNNEETKEFSRGLCVHAIFEGQNAIEACREYDVSPDEIPKILESKEYFESHSLMQNRMNVWYELEIITESSECRRPDVVVKYTDGSYRIFDFKTGKLSDLKSKLREQYYQQVTEYAKIVAQVFNVQDKIPSYFYFTDERKFVSVDEIISDSSKDFEKN